MFVSPSQNGEQCIVGSAFEKHTSKIMSYIRMAQSKRIFPNKIVPAWSTESTKQGEAGVFALYLLKAERGGKAFMSGEFITSAKSDIQQGQDIVSLDFKAAASVKVRRKVTVLSSDSIIEKSPTELTLACPPIAEWFVQ